MSGNVKEIKRNHPYFQVCPICGHEGWCFTSTDGKGNLYVMCNRDTLKMDQNGFTYIGDTRTGISKYIFGSREYVYKDDWRPVPPKPQKKEDDIPRLEDAILDKMYKQILSMLILEDSHREYLHTEGITDKMIKKYQIKSFPVTDGKRFKEKIKTSNPKRFEIGSKLFERFGDLKGLPGAYLAKSKKSNNYYWTFACKSGIVFPIKNINGEIVMLQIRLDNPGPKGPKYKALTSPTEYYFQGCSPGNRVGLVIPSVIGDTFVVYITEGIKKAIAIAEKLGCIALTVQGVNSWGELVENKNDQQEMLVEKLKKKYGSKLLIIAYDSDKKKNEYVMNAQNKIVDALKEHGFTIGLAEWEEWMGKGIDDMLNNGYKLRYDFA